MTQPKRHGSTDFYRYGFQGQEKDDEVKGEGNSLNYKYRMHDPRVGRFFAVDPLSYKYPHYTPYSFSENKVIQFVELEGLEESPNIYEFDPYKEGIAADQIWDGIVDGFGNILIGSFRLYTSDETEGEYIRKFLNKHKVDIPEGVTNEQLGEKFNFKKRNRTVVVEPDEGVLSEFLDYTLSVIDASSISVGKSGVFMAIKAAPVTNRVISKVLRGLKVNARTKQILEEFKDVGGQGSFRKVEAEGVAIFEETFQTTVRAIDNLDNKAGDFIVISGKYQGKSVDLVSAVNDPNFKLEKFIDSVDRHYVKDGVDYINIDIRSLDDTGKKAVKDHIGKMSEANQLKTIITE